MGLVMGNVDFSNSKDLQLIYSSQLYGTFFSIYAKINLDNGKTDEKSYHLNSIDLKIVNYKGLINLGMVRARFKKRRNGGEILIDVQGLGGEPQINVECNHVEAPFSKTRKSYLYVERTARPMHGDFGNGVVLNNGVFDEEFYFREGFRPKKNDTSLAGIQLEQDHKAYKVRPKLYEERTRVAGGFRCPKSINAVK